jgi:hypothetical protein
MKYVPSVGLLLISSSRVLIDKFRVPVSVSDIINETRNSRIRGSILKEIDF